MKSLAVFEDQSLKIVDVPVPEYGDYECLVKMESCGVCNGTDMKIIHGKLKGFDTYPALLGHEGVGRVVEKGAKVTSFEIGDLVTLPFIGKAPEGYYSGWGTYSEYNIIADYKAKLANGIQPDECDYAQRKLPADFDPVDSAMIITFREVLSEAKTFGFEPNQSVFIMGMGPVGLCFVKFAKLMGMGPVIACDRDRTGDKLEYAKKIGADYVVNTKEDIVKFARKICPDGIDHVVDAVGINSFINQAMEMISYDGNIDVYGISETLKTEIDWSKAPFNWKLKFSTWPSKILEGEAHLQICSWIQSGVLNPKDFVSHVFPLDEAQKACDMVKEKPKGMRKIVIKLSE